MPVTLTIDVERETDDRFVAEVPELPGVLVHGHTEASAVATAQLGCIRCGIGPGDRSAKAGDLVIQESP